MNQSKKKVDLLRDAKMTRVSGIVVWVLTGDKQETAVSIGYSSQVYSHDTVLHTFKTTTIEATRQKLIEVMAFTPTGQVGAPPPTS